jgi:hypothetical protein
MKKTIFSVAAFAVFATTILLLGQVAQPVSIQAMDQQKDLDQLEREAKAFEKELEPYAKALAEDDEVRGLFVKLKHDPTIIDFINEIKNTEANEDNAEKLKDYAEDLRGYLETNEDAQKLQGIISETHTGLLAVIESNFNQKVKDFEDEKISEETLVKQLAQKMETMDLEKNPESEIDWEELINIIISVILVVLGVIAAIIILFVLIFLMGACTAVGAIVLAVILGYICEFIFNVVSTVVTLIIAAALLVLFAIEQIIDFLKKFIPPITESPVAKSLPSNSNALLDAIFKMLARLRIVRQFA